MRRGILKKKGFKRKYKKSIPPKTLRYCKICKHETYFKYNRNVLHSVCTECGMRNLK